MTILHAVSLDEAFYFMEEIKKEKLRDALLMTSIVSAPHMDDSNRKSFVEGLQKELRKYEKTSIIDIYPEKGAFDKLRTLLGSPKKQK